MLPHTVRTRAILLVVLLATAAAVPAMAQGQPVAQKPVTAADYARAEKFLAAGVTPLVVGGTVQPSWLPDDRFYYRNTTAEGSEFVLVSPATKSRVPGLRSREAGRRALGGRWQHLRSEEAAVHGHHAVARRQDRLVRPREAPVDVRRAGREMRGDRGGDGRGPAWRWREVAGAALPAARQVFRRRHRRPTASARSSSATGTSGCATWRPGRRSRSPPTA